MIDVSAVTKTYRTRQGPLPVLRGISFSLGRGEKLGLLGRNGAGKSTLMRLLGGVEKPTSGRIELNGMSMSWPLGFGGALHGSLTGYDNVRFIARVYGREFEEVLDYVESFAELGKHLREPVKTYSTGMRARLGFGLSLAVSFDCYLVDEVIGAGDRRFRDKCREEMFEKRKGRAMILATHNVEVIRDHCDAALVLRDGHGKVFRDVGLAIDIYRAL